MTVTYALILLIRIAILSFQTIFSIIWLMMKNSADSFQNSFISDINEQLLKHELKKISPWAYTMGI